MTRGRVTREDWTMAALRALARGALSTVAGVAFGWAVATARPEVSAQPA